MTASPTCTISPSLLSQRNTLALVVGIPPVFGTFNVVRMTMPPLRPLPIPSMNFTIHGCPKLFPHCFAIELSGWRLGDFRHELHCLGRLHAAQFRLAVSDDLTLIERFAQLQAAPQNDQRLDRFSPLVVGHADDGALLHLWQGHNAGLDLRAV